MRRLFHDAGQAIAMENSAALLYRWPSHAYAHKRTHTGGDLMYSE